MDATTLPVQTVSPRGTINVKDYKSIAITLLMTGVSAIVAQAIVLVPFLDLGHNTILYTAIILSLLKIVQKTVDGPKVVN